MDELTAKLVTDLRVFIVKLIQQVDGHIDENFYSEEVISQNLIVEEKVNDGIKIISAKLEDEYEYNLFNNLLYDEKLRRFYHYTSMESLYFILNSGKIHLNSLVGLNDKSELNLVNNYMGKGFSNPNHPVTIAYHNTHFVFCFSENKDQLNQWRLYGDDAKGVMLEFDIDHHMFPYRNMKISKVAYSLDLFRLIKEWLAYCKNDLKVSFGFHQIDYWKFFYKNEDYKDENEVRLLVKNPLNPNLPPFTQEKYKLNRYGIIVPYLEIDCVGADHHLIRLKNIMIGPKCAEADLKQAQINYMLSRVYPEYEIHVEKSRIDHYR